jgi:GNAT superfamily N-acetyltransferase
MDLIQSEDKPSAESTTIQIRPATERDLNLIFSSWLKSYRPSLFAQKISNEVFYKEHHDAVERALKRSTILIASNPEDENHVYGWICFEDTGPISVLHYLYVKNPFRGFGIAKQLLRKMKPGVFVYTHHTQHFSRLATGAVYSPYLFFGGTP